MEATVRMTLLWIFSGFYWLVFVIAYFMSFKQFPVTWVQKVIQLWGKTTLQILGIQVELLNENNINHQESRIVICNHQSALDTLWGAMICPPAPLVIGKKEILYVPILNLLWWVFKFIRIDRSNSIKAIHRLKNVATEIVQNKRSLYVSPEGTRTPHGSILPFKKGPFHIAIESQAPICPVVVVGCFELMPKGKLRAKPGRIRIKFLPPISTRGLTVQDLNSLIERTRNTMIQAYEEIQS